MKKTFLTSLLALSLCLVLSGCDLLNKDETKAEKATKKTIGTKILECTQNEDDTEMTMTFKYNKLKKEFTAASAKMTMDVPKEYQSYYKDADLCSLFTSNSDVYENCEAKFEENTIELAFNINLDKLEEESDENFKKDMSIEDAKKQLEEDGATCKIK